MAVWLEVLATVVGVVTVAFAVLLFWRGKRSLTTSILGTWLLLLGLFYIVSGLAAAVGLPQLWQVWLNFLLGFPRPYLVAAFGFVFLRHVLGRMTRVALFVLAALALANGVVFLIARDVFLTPTGEFTPAATTLMGSVIGGSYVVTIGALGWRWLKAPAGAYRTQLLWGILPFGFWTIHDGLGFGLLPALLGTRVGALVPWFVLHSPPPATLLVWLTGLSFAVVLTLGAGIRVFRGAPGRDARVLFLAFLYALPVSLVQLFEPGLHLPVDAIIVPLVAYGVVRHQVVDVDLRLRWTVKQGTVAGIALAAFFIATELGQILFEGLFGGPVLGVVAAGALVFAFTPLQHFADRVSAVALPHVVDRGAHLEARMREIYRVAAEELLADGTVTQKERAALVRLRVQLGMDPRTAAGIEAEVERGLTASA